MRRFLQNSVVSGIFISPLFFPALAAPPVDPKSVWDVSLGLGVAVVPTFEGSNSYKTLPVPVISATYRDMISFDINGLNAYWHTGNLKIGGGLTFEGGRKDSKSGDIFESGDDRLRGLGNIDSALGFRAFASYHLGPVEFGGALTKFTGDQNRGVLADWGVSLAYPLNKRLTITPHLGVTWANGSYMETFFGVTPTQSANSGFAQFNAKSGIKDVDASISLDYQISKHWFADTHLQLKQLTGDAADSPISFSNTQVGVLALIGYHF